MAREAENLPGEPSPEREERLVKWIALVVPLFALLILLLAYVIEADVL
jgi:uncharacterized integral membrane protein